MTGIPFNLQSLIIKVAELEVKANFAQGQANLLLAFIASNPDNLTKFASITKTCLTDPITETHTRDVAKQLLDAGLSQYLPSQPPSHQQTPSQRHETAKIIQFPIKPKKDHPADQP